MNKGEKKEPIKSEIIIGEGFTGGLNIDITDQGYIKRRKGYRTFGDMVDTLWNINKNLKKHCAKVQYTVDLPLKGCKPIYKKTLKGIKI